jgi:hypothetical protein
MRALFAALICLSFAVVLSGDPAERLDISTNGGELVATLHTAGGAVAAFDYVKDGCFFSPDHSEPCFTFSAGNGTEAIPINGCVSNEQGRLNVGAAVGCPAKNIKTVKLALPRGGMFNLYIGNGQHNDCSPAPVTIEVNGVFHVGAWDGCSETISCLGGTGSVDADTSDAVKQNCDPAFVTRH